MATTKEVDIVFNHLMKSPSFELLKLFNDTNSGIGAVLRILKESKSPVSAKKISKIMAVSEARMTTLLKKMQNRGYIAREKDSCDARAYIIKLTKEGAAQAERLHDMLCKNIETIINSVGLEKIKQYMKLTDEINNAIQNQLPLPPEIK